MTLILSGFKNEEKAKSIKVYFLMGSKVVYPIGIPKKGDVSRFERN